MANEVFANGLEIACKAGVGKSVACFPDVCFTPPSPPAGWIPIPYANTAYDKDTTNASKTVFISGKPVMKKDVSYFKTSTGNEPAAGPKGIITGVKKGKAYFASWSMNVKIEGKNVDRHTDKMTHNHGSVANTGPWDFLDSKNAHNCEKEKKRMKHACGEKRKKDNAPNKHKKKPKDRGMVSDGAAKSKHWKQTHCDGLNKKPDTYSKEDFKKLKKEMEEKVKSITDLENMVKKLVNELEDKAYDVAKKSAAKVAIKAGLKGWLGPVGWVWTGYDIASTALMVKDMYKFISEVKGQIAELKSFANSLKIMDGTDLEKNIAEIMKYRAKLNECIRTRKCQLVPFTQTTSGERTTMKGCCKGQTGHHIIPDSFYHQGTVEEGKIIEDCPNYKTDEAPTVCAEGTKKEHGSHGDMHLIFQQGAKNGKNKYFYSSYINYKPARAAAIKSLKVVSPLSRCSAKCLKAQLDFYRKKACKGSNPSLKYKKVVEPKVKRRVQGGR